MIRVLIVAQIRLYCEGLAEILGRQEQFAVVGTACSCAEAQDLIPKLRPSVVLLDLAVPESLATARALSELDPPTRLVALAVPESEQDVVACAEAGVSAWVAREASLEDLIRAIRVAVLVELMFSAKSAGSLLRHVRTRAAAGSPATGRDRLTPRQLEIVSLVDIGLCNKEIARDLGIEVSTVKNHVHNILDRLRVHHRGQAAAVLRPFLRVRSLRAQI